MEPNTGDFSLYNKKNSAEELDGMVGVNIDDSMGTGNKEFEEISRRTEKNFGSQHRISAPLMFAGFEVEPEDDEFIT